MYVKYGRKRGVVKMDRSEWVLERSERQGTLTETIMIGFILTEREGEEVQRE